MVTNVAEELLVLKSHIKLKIAEYELRTGNKFINKKAADKLDMLPQHFSALVNGKVLTTVEKTFKLATLLECKVDDLYEYHDIIDDIFEGHKEAMAQKIKKAREAALDKMEEGK